MKKNTLLYLDSDLVSKAKEANINISQLAEKALKEELRAAHPETARGFLQKIIAETGQRGKSFYGEGYLLPFQIESIHLQNVGLFKDFEVHFKRDLINVIQGFNATGKSTVIRSIMQAFGNQRSELNYIENGTITLKIFPDQQAATIKTGYLSQEGNLDGYRCFVADEILQLISKEVQSAVFQELSKIKTQAIITTTTPIEQLKLPENSNVIQIESSD